MSATSLSLANPIIISIILLNILTVNKNLKIKIKIKKSLEGYAVWVPELKGCWSQGKNEIEAVENIIDAIHLYFETFEEIQNS
ncbi:MAG TPA: type II toxin-antitoxin system HicB family antitoxin [Ignavibacteria bacterium]|nr:type II toxin-antitoxin system HicB family antitoxin [Ignavibacteria bacterium]